MLQKNKQGGPPPTLSQGHRRTGNLHPSRYMGEATVTARGKSQEAVLLGGKEEQGNIVGGS